jgi:hypothetical protein
MTNTKTPPAVRRGRWRVDYPGRHGTNSRWFRTRKEAVTDYGTHRQAEIYVERRRKGGDA